MITPEQIFSENSKEYLKFERIEEKLSQRPDIHALMLIDRLLPESGNIIDGIDEDELILDVNTARFFKAATPKDIIDLIRCGVSFDKDMETLSLFCPGL